MKFLDTLIYNEERYVKLSSLANWLVSYIEALENAKNDSSQTVQILAAMLEMDLRTGNE